MSPARRAAALAAALLFGATACSAGGDDGFEIPVPDSKIDVDTPKLREMKADAGIEPCPASPAKGAGNDLPEVSLPCLGGGPAVRIDAVEGPAVVNFWASWCDPCRRELPVLQEVSDRYAGRVAFVGVDFTDPQTEAAMQLLADSGVTYPQLADPGGDLIGTQILKRMTHVPTTAFIDADGRTESVVEEITSADQLERLIFEHLGVAP